MTLLFQGFLPILHCQFSVTLSVSTVRYLSSKILTLQSNSAGNCQIRLKSADFDRQIMTDCSCKVVLTSFLIRTSDRFIDLENLAEVTL